MRWYNRIGQCMIGIPLLSFVGFLYYMMWPESLYITLFFLGLFLFMSIAFTLIDHP